MLALRLVYTGAVAIGMVWLLRAGQPLGGLVLLPLLAMVLRRSAESGRIGRAAGHLRHS